MLSVEFIGIPGAGKSYIQKHLINALRLTGGNKYMLADEAYLQASKNNIDKVYRYILKTLPNDLASKFLGKLINRSNMQFEAQNRFLAKWGKSLEIFLSSREYTEMETDDRAIRVSVFLHAAAFFECLHSYVSKNSVVIFDELFVQKSFIFVSHLIKISKDDSDVTRFLENVPLSKVIIHVKADINTCYKRMTTRERGVIKVLKDSSKEEIFQFLEVSEKHMQTVIGWLQNRKDVVLLEVDNRGELDQMVEDLRKMIITHF